MNISNIIQNTRDRTANDAPNKNLANAVCELLAEVYPQGHMFESEMTFESSGPIYADYPEFIHAQMAWGKATLKFVGLDYPVILPHQHFLSDMRLKALMASNRKLDADDLAAGSGFMAVSVNVLHNVRDAIINKLAIGDFIPLEFTWMSRDHATHQYLSFVVDVKNERINAIVHGVRPSSHGHPWIYKTVYEDGGGSLPPLCEAEKHAHTLNIARTLVEDITERTKASKNPLNDYAYFVRNLINTQCIKVSHLPNEFVGNYVVKEPSSFDWRYVDERPMAGKFYHKWTVKNTTHVGLLTNVKSANGGLCILWFSLIYEDKEHKLYLSSDNIERKLLKKIPLREVCGRKCELGHPVNKDGWEEFRVIIDQLTKE